MFNIVSVLLHRIKAFIAMGGLLGSLIGFSVAGFAQSPTRYVQDPCKSHQIRLRDEGDRRLFSEESQQFAWKFLSGRYPLKLDTLEGWIFPGGYFPLPDTASLPPKETVHAYVLRADSVWLGIRLHQDPVYMCCETPCDGEVVDRYQHGQVRIRGHFFEGYPIDTVFTYWPSGILREVYSRRWRESYDEQGKLVSHYRGNSSEDRFVRTLYEYHPDGERRRVESFHVNMRRGNSHDRLEEYDAQGQILRDQKRRSLRLYYPDGQLKLKVRRWRIVSLSDFDRDFPGADYLYRATYYRPDGRVQERLRVYSFAAEPEYWPRELASLDFVGCYTAYDAQGKLIFRLRKVQPEEIKAFAQVWKW